VVDGPPRRTPNGGRLGERQAAPHHRGGPAAEVEEPADAMAASRVPATRAMWGVAYGHRVGRGHAELHGARSPRRGTSVSRWGVGALFIWCLDFFWLSPCQ